VKTDFIREIRFGMLGNDAYYLGEGWGGAEAESRRTVGRKAEIWFDNPGQCEGFLLQFEFSPFGGHAEAQPRRFEVWVYGALVGRKAVDANGRVEVRIPGELLATNRRVQVVLRCEHAGDPEKDADSGDGISFALRKLRLHRLTDNTNLLFAEGIGGITIDEMEMMTRMPAAQFMLGFESLSENCEFGFAQRRCGAEPLGLLRFSNIEPPDLLHAVRNRFQGIGKPENLEFALSPEAPRQYEVRDKTYALFHHTGLYEGQIEEPALRKVQSTRLNILARKLLFDLSEGVKFFIVKHNIELTIADVLTLHTEMRAYGPNTLIWVVASSAHKPGSVEYLLPGLLKAYVGRFAPYENADDFALEPWLEICLNARRLTSLYAPAGASAPAKPALALSELTGRETDRELAPVVLEIGAHIQNTGNVWAWSGEWIGQPNTGRAIEAFMVRSGSEIGENDLEYQAMYDDQSGSPWVPAGSYCGSRGQDKPLKGFRLRLKGPAAAAFDCTYRASFTDGSETGPIPSGEVCATTDGGWLETFHVSIIRRPLNTGAMAA
jgi:hypothetical protein